MKLVFPTLAHKEAANDYIKEHKDNNEEHINGSSSLMQSSDYESWLEKITWNLNNSTEDWVTGEVYFLIENDENYRSDENHRNDEIIGTIAIRHYLNDALMKSGGHIGYGIRPSMRGKGYGIQMLALALERCKELDMKKVLITCREGNIASAKTAMHHGAVYENSIVEEDGKVVQRYWIDLT